MSFTLGTRSRANLAGVHPDLIRIIEGAIVSSTVDFGVAAPAVRTAEEQNRLFKLGRTQKDGITHKSNHQPWADDLGHAVDLTPFVGGQFIVTDGKNGTLNAWDYYPTIAAAMSLSAKALGLAQRLTWGCNWLEPMSAYGSTVQDMKDAIERYKRNHPGPDFIDGPHFQIT